MSEEQWSQLQAMRKGHQAGKGDKRRPMDREKYEENYDKIDWRGDTMSTYNGEEDEGK